MARERLYHAPDRSRGVRSWDSAVRIGRGFWDFGWIWSGRPDSNRRHRPWQGRTLPAELLPRSRREGPQRTDSLSRWLSGKSNLRVNGELTEFQGIGGLPA